MNKSLIPFAALVVLLFTGCPTQRGKDPVFSFNQVRVNVILIITDDQGYGDLSCHGNPDLQTPNFDALHAQSVRLTDFHVDPTCSPTRAALMTGRYSCRVGVWLTYGGRNHLRKDEVTLANAFKNTGYKTAIYGKWHLGDNYPFRPQDRGFEESLIHGGGVVGETPDFWGNDYYDDTYFRNGEPEKVEGYCTDVWFREAISWIDSNKEDPFFVYLATNAPHGPLNVPIQYVQPFLDAGHSEQKARYYGMIHSIDENVGKLRSRLDEMQLTKDTMIIFVTDNGTTRGADLNEEKFVRQGYNAGMRGRKTNVYEGGHRAAGFFYWPRGNFVPPQDISQLTAHIDIMPTLIDLCNLDMPRKIRFDGRSLKPLLRADADQWKERTLFVHHQGRFNEYVGDGFLFKNRDYAVMTEEWRLVRDELFAIQSDPEQRNDVSAENPKIVKKLRSAYEKWWDDIYEGSEAYVPFVLDSSKQEVTTLSSQNWHGDRIPYSQQMVRAGMKASGFWALDVTEAGTYEIVVRRWPKEVDVPLRGISSPYNPNTALHHASSHIYKAATMAIPVKSVRLKVGNYDETLAVRETDTEAFFNIYLPVGEQKLQAWLITDSGDSWGAYYVYVKKS
ncbi:MAG: N-acetylgalactosamine-4-sulfatase [Opitutaceae bacterium]|nr:N-acetylgalactosamine-4-sulfatase [Opitutaceae bacterium]